MLRTASLGLALLVTTALSLAVASIAAAAQPEFKPSTKQKFTSTSGTSVLTTAGQSITCSKGSSIGEATGTTSVASLVITLTGCKAKKGSETCEAKSVGGKAETIVTNTLKGNLGAVSASEAATEVGLLLEPGSGSTLAKLAAGTCTSEASITGKLAGEIKTVNKSQTTNTLVFGVTGGKQNIKSLVVLGKTVEPTLTAFGISATESITEDVQLEKAVEVTAVAPPPAPSIEQVNFTNNLKVSIDHREEVNHEVLTEKAKKKEAAPEKPLAINSFEGEDEIEWKAPNGEVKKNWPVAYPQGKTVELEARFALKAATREFIEKKLESELTIVGETTVGGVTIKFKASMTAAAAAAQVAEHPAYLQASGIKASAALPEEVGYSLITIKWKWTIKEKGGAPVEQALGNSEHNLYLIYKEVKGTGPLYYSLLVLATEGVEKESRKPTEAQVISGVWKSFSHAEGGIPTARMTIYNPANGAFKAGATLWYYEDLVKEGKTLTEVDTLEEATGAFKSNLNSAVKLLEFADGECKGWQEAFGTSLEAEGLNYEKVEVVVKFEVGECATAGACSLLVKNWIFPKGEGKANTKEEEEKKEPTFPYLPGEINGQSGAVGQGVESPSSDFTNHQLVEVDEKLYDPSYGQGPLEGAKRKLEYQEKNIEAFCKQPFRANMRCRKASATELQLAFKNT